MTLQKAISFALITIIFIPFHFAQTVIHGNIRIDREKLSAFGDSLKLRLSLQSGIRDKIIGL